MEYFVVLDGGVGVIWFNELIWCEFYCYLMVYYLKFCKGWLFIVWIDKVVWCVEEVFLQVWQCGEIGFLIVDVVMCQFNVIGWMYNWLCMIVVSFLIKDLCFDWWVGECYFMSQLIDGDLVVNNGGWQWVVLMGIDVVFYFCIFNFIIQGEKFDKQGVFICCWLLELVKVLEKVLYQLWVWVDK